MNLSRGQGQLFPNHKVQISCDIPQQQITCSKELLINWQKRVHTHQSKLFKGKIESNSQGSIFLY